MLIYAVYLARIKGDDEALTWRHVCITMYLHLLHHEPLVEIYKRDQIFVKSIVIN